MTDQRVLHGYLCPLTSVRPNLLRTFGETLKKARRILLRS